MGLRCGLGADAVILNDAGPWSQVWAILADPANCAEVARILRGWADEDPRALWERLREEHRGEWDGWGAERAAGWVVKTGWTRGDGALCVAPGACPDNVNPAATLDSIATRVESVAAWLQVGANSWKGQGEHFAEQKPNDGSGTRHAVTQDERLRPEVLASRIEGLSPALSVYAGPAESLDPPDDCDGVYMLIDPPYHGENGTEKITGYAHDLPRPALLTLLRRWSDAGAVVCCCESVPLADDMGSGWRSVDIGHARVGQRRTFARVTSEFITLNREPAEVPATQVAMFG